MHLLTDILAPLVVIAQLMGIGAVTWGAITRLSKRSCPDALYGWAGWLALLGALYVLLGMFDAPALWDAARNDVADFPTLLLVKTLLHVAWLWLLWWALMYRTSGRRKTYGQ